MSQNHELVSHGFHSLLKAFAPYVCAMLKAQYGERWWADAVMGKLWEEQR